MLPSACKSCQQLTKRTLISLHAIRARQTHSGHTVPTRCSGFSAMQPSTSQVNIFRTSPQWQDRIWSSSALCRAPSGNRFYSTSGEPILKTPPGGALEPEGVVRRSSTSGMSGSKTPSLTAVFSDENRDRVMNSLSAKRTLRRFYTKDVKQRGAVVVPLCSVNGEPGILFTLRTRNLKDHSGEVSFPGGKMDPTDKDVCYTALRELHEELGIPPETVEVWGNLSPLGRETMTVVPVIGYLGEVDVENLRYNPDEVSAVFMMTLSHLCSPASQAYTIFEPHEFSGQPNATLPVFVGGAHRVWGLTATILDQALQAIVPGHYRSLVTQVKKELASSSR